MRSLRSQFRTAALAVPLAAAWMLAAVSAWAAPVDELANCGKRISEGLQKYTQNYTTGLGNCYLANDSLVFPIDCREDQRTKGIIGSAREKLQTATVKCTAQGLDLLCPFEQRLPGDLYDWLVLDPNSYETRVDALLDSIFRTTHAPSCPRPAGSISRAGIDCGRTLSGQLPKGLSQIQQCVAKCEIGVTKNGGEPCVDFATGEVKDPKTIDCIGRVRERLFSVLDSRCSDATVVELGCPLAATTESAMVAALDAQVAAFTTDLSRDMFHSSCRTYIPVGLVPTTATATLLPSATPVEIHCGQTLDAAFFGTDNRLLLTQDLDCADAGATDGLVIAASGVQLDLGDSFRISGPRRASERTGVGIRIASGATDVLVNRGLVQKFGIGVADTDASCADSTLRELQVRDNATQGVVMKGLRTRLDTLSVKNNGGDGIVLDGSNGTLTASTCEDNGGSGAVVNGFDNEVESNAFGNLRDRGNAGHGLVVNAGGNHVYSNYAAVNGGDGLRIRAATAPIFDSNTAVGNGGAGIRLGAAGSQVESNRSEKNADYEYLIAAGNTDLGNNRANGATFAFPPGGGNYE